MSQNQGLQKGWSRSWSAGFDTVADAYDSARPGYPTQLYEDLRAMCGLGRDTSVLEIGCGTGQATVDLAPLAGSVVALEPGAALAERARMRLSDFQNVKVIEAAFEYFDGESGAFDLIVSATAFHWVDSEIGFSRAAKLLRPGGRLALWWTVYHDPDGDDPFGDEVTRLIDHETGTSTGTGQEYALRTDERTADFASSDAFGSVETRRYRWIGDHSVEEIRDLFSTYSNVQAMEEPVRRRILDGIEEIAATKFEGRVTRPYVTALYAAEKIEDVK